MTFIYELFLKPWLLYWQLIQFVPLTWWFDEDINFRFDECDESIHHLLMPESVYFFTVQLVLMSSALGKKSITVNQFRKVKESKAISCALTWNMFPLSILFCKAFITYIFSNKWKMNFITTFTCFSRLDQSLPYLSGSLKEETPFMLHFSSLKCSHLCSGCILLLTQLKD